MTEPLATLAVVRPHTDPDVVRLAKRIYEMAEAGDILALVVVGERTAGSSMFIEHEVSVGAEFYGLVGALEDAKLKLLSVRSSQK